MKKNIVRIFLMFFIIASVACGQKGSVASGDKYRNYYEIFVRSFYDSDGDGIGDINGIIKRLDYLNDGKVGSNNSLAIDGIWLMPIMPSPTYHKYDVTDYYGIDTQYGTMSDFEKLIAECQKRGIAVIIDLVINHTSARHPWFLSAISSIGTEPCGTEICLYDTLCREHNPYCGYYNFERNMQTGGYYSIGMPEGWSYQGVFWDQMPDLNLSNADVKSEIQKIVKFWIDKGVAGFRLDAVTQFVDENTSKNVEILRWFCEEAKKVKSDVYIVGEAWTTAGNIESYYASSADSFFNFPFADSSGLIAETLRKSDGRRLASAIAEWDDKIRSQNQEAIDAVFISNHDMSRSAGFLMRNPVLEKMCASIYLLMPGNSFIYYGEEIGMTGSGIDENKRQPMVWSVADKTGETMPPDGVNQEQSLEGGVKEQLKDESSLLRFYQKVLRIKGENPEISRGYAKALDVESKAVCAYSCEYNGSKVYIFHNLSDSQEEISLPKTKYPYNRLNAYLETDGNQVTLKADILTLPPYSTAILK